MSAQNDSDHLAKPLGEGAVAPLESEAGSLLPCAHCDGLPLLASDLGLDYDEGTIVCDDCGATAPTADAWNHRAVKVVAWWCIDLITQETSITTDENHAKARSAVMYQGEYVWDVHPLCFA